MAEPHLAYDPAIGRTVLLSSVGTWLWDGTDWSAAFPDTTIGNGCGVTTPDFDNLAFDAASGQLIAFGTSTSGCNPRPNRTTWVLGPGQPTISGIAPSSGPPGSTVEISGSGFGTVPGSLTFTPPAPAAAVTVPGADPTWGHTQVEVTVPRGLPPGPVTLSVYNAQTGATSAPAPVSFLVTAPTASPLVIAAPASLEAVSGSPYQAAFRASGGTAPYVWSIASGAPRPRSP